MRTHNTIFIESQIVWQDNLDSPVEFPNQATNPSIIDDNEAHTIDKEEITICRSRSEVWGTDPTRRSKQISNKVLITKVTDDTPETSKIKIPKAFQDAIDSPEGNLWKDTMITNSPN